MTTNSFLPQPCPPEDLENALLTVEAIQAELNYKQAQDSLRSLVNQLDLTVQEQKGLEMGFTDHELQIAGRSQYTILDSVKV